MVAAARKAKRVSLEGMVSDAPVILALSPRTSPNWAVGDKGERASQLAENGSAGTRRGCAGVGAVAGAGAARRSRMSRRVTSALTVTVALPLRSTLNRASAVASLEPTFRVVTSTLKALRWVAALTAAT